jgi:hypothetical protein
VDAGVGLQVVLSGLATGAVLGLVALGFSLVAGTVRVLHLAHGDVVVAAVFTGVLAVLGSTPVATVLPAGSALAFIGLVLLAGAAVRARRGAGGAPEPAGRRGRAGDVLGWVAGGVAAGLLLREVLGLLLPQQAYAVPDPLRLDALVGGGLVDLPGGSTLPVRVLAVLAIGLAVGLLAERLLVRSRVRARLAGGRRRSGRCGAVRCADPSGGAARVRAGRAAGRSGRPARRTRALGRPLRKITGGLGLTGLVQTQSRHAQNVDSSPSGNALYVESTGAGIGVGAVHDGLG